MWRSRITCYLISSDAEHHIMTQRRLEGKVAIVTGAASGFGNGIATKFVQDGAKVLIADLSAVPAEAVAQKLGCKSTVAKVTKRENWNALLKTALEDGS